MATGNAFEASFDHGFGTFDVFGINLDEVDVWDQESVHGNTFVNDDTWTNFDADGNINDQSTGAVWKQVAGEMPTQSVVENAKKKSSEKRSSSDKHRSKSKKSEKDSNGKKKSSSTSGSKTEGSKHKDKEHKERDHPDKEHKEKEHKDKESSKKKRGKSSTTTTTTITTTTHEKATKSSSGSKKDKDSGGTTSLNQFLETIDRPLVIASEDTSIAASEPPLIPPSRRTRPSSRSRSRKVAPALSHYGFIAELREAEAMSSSRHSRPSRSRSPVSLAKMKASADRGARSLSRDRRKEVDDSIAKLSEEFRRQGAEGVKLSGFLRENSVSKSSGSGNRSIGSARSAPVLPSSTSQSRGRNRRWTSKMSSVHEQVAERANKLNKKTEQFLMSKDGIESSLKKEGRDRDKKSSRKQENPEKVQTRITQEGYIEVQDGKMRLVFDVDG